MLVCVAASGERCCGADLLLADVGFETCFEGETGQRAPWQRDTLLRVRAHVFESEIASERSGIIVRVGNELGTRIAVSNNAAAAASQPASQ